jgi:cytosine/adenosine deaminase-related metal-dependent hydrolase
VVDLTTAGAPVGLGVDGVASNEIGGLFPELRMALFLARQRDLSSTTFVPADAPRLADQGRHPLPWPSPPAVPPHAVGRDK